MMTREILELAQKFHQRGIQKGYELLLSPADSLELTRQLAAQNVLVIGCDSWRYVDKAKGWIVQGWELELSVESHIPSSEITVEASTTLIEAFLTKQVPSSIDFISLTIADPDIAALFVK